MTAALEAEALQYAYPDGTVAVDGIDMRIAQGERVALLGPNGAGKSTLLSLLGGLLRPDGGTVRYFGTDRRADDLRARVAVVTQNPADYLFNPTVREDLEYGPAQLDIPRDEARRRVDRLADRFDLQGLLDKPPFRLSGGERRRAAIASALAIEPDLLLLDEPVSDVDAAYASRIQSHLDELHAAGVSVVISTPDVDLVPTVADRVYLLDADGTIVRDGPVSEVLTEVETLQDCDLAPPKTVELFERAEFDSRPVTVDAAVDQLQNRPPDR